MTALSSALAMIPLAINGDLPGNEIQSPMAKVILGGLLTSTLLNGFIVGGLLTSTLLNGFIVPIVYDWMHRRERRAENIEQA